MTNNTTTGEKRKQPKPDAKRSNKRSKTVTHAHSTNDSPNVTTDANSKIKSEIIPDKRTPSDDATKSPSPLSSSSTIDDADVSVVVNDVGPGPAVGSHDDTDSAIPVVHPSAIEQSAIQPSNPGDVGFTVKGEIITFNAPNVTPLQRVAEQGCRFKGVRSVDHLPFCRLQDYLATNSYKALRILRYSAEAVGNNMTCIFKARPSDFTRVTTNSSFQSRRVVYTETTNVSDGAKIDSTFFLVGRVVQSALQSDDDNVYIRELAVQPIHRFLPRTVSAIAQILDFRRPMFSLKEDGLQFTTARKPFEDRSKGPVIRYAPMNGVTHGPSPRSWKDKVPVFDGRSRFQLANYATLPRLSEELEVGDFAVVAFTLAGWRNNKVAANDAKAERVSLNIQFTILLERPVANDQDGFSAPLPDDLKDETPLGVEDTRPMKDILPNELTDVEVASQIHTLSATFNGPAM